MPIFVEACYQNIFSKSNSKLKIILHKAVSFFFSKYPETFFKHKIAISAIYKIN